MAIGPVYLPTVYVFEQFSLNCLVLEERPIRAFESLFKLKKWKLLHQLPCWWAADVT